MSGCCSGATRVLVEVERLVVGGETCERCGDTWEAAEAAVALVAGEASGIGMGIDLVERPLPPDRIDESNRVLVAGRAVEEWLNGSVSFTDCPSCGDLVGGSACCRAYEIDGETREALSAEDIARAIRLAAGLTPRVRVPRSVVSASRTVPVTLVTSDSCGWGGAQLCDPGSAVTPALLEGSTWDMPSTWRAHVITEHLQASGIVAVVVERDVYALSGDERHAVLDAMIRDGAEAPMVVVDGRVACTGGVDLEAVLAAARTTG